jgi:hypothetical protein
MAEKKLTVSKNNIFTMLDKNDLKAIKQIVKEGTDDVAIAVNKGFDESEGKMNDRFDEVERRLTKVEANMVTRDYLDDKMTDLRGDLVVLMRKEDNKLKTLIDILKEKRVISSDDEKRILAMEPFPELSVRLDK